MKIVIDIEEAIYKKCIPYKDTPIISNLANYNSEIIHAIANGTPQPEKRTEKRTETHSCDCISRASVNELVDELARRLSDERCGPPIRGREPGVIMHNILDLPSVEPERKTGKWKHMVGFWECDQCNAEYTDMPTCMGTVIYEYCPTCGCRMKGEG